MCNERHGKGVEEIKELSRFTGNFVNGKKWGQGKLESLWHSGGYEGNFNDNMMSGWGVYKYPDGRSYTGDWLDDKMHGEGRFHWPDGRSYKGSYVHDKKEGFGIFTWANGKWYEGAWRDGRQHGIGT